MKLEKEAGCEGETQEIGCSHVLQMVPQGLPLGILVPSLMAAKEAQ